MNTWRLRSTKHVKLKPVWRNENLSRQTKLRLFNNNVKTVLLLLRQKPVDTPRNWTTSSRSSSTHVSVRFWASDCQSASLTKTSGEEPGRSPSPTPTRAASGCGSGTPYAESGPAAPNKFWNGSPRGNGKEEDQVWRGQNPASRANDHQHDLEWGKEDSPRLGKMEACS